MITALEKAAISHKFTAASLAKIQKRLDVIDEQYYNDPAKAGSYHKLLEAQALILGLQNKDDEARAFMKEAVIAAGGRQHLSSKLVRQQMHDEQQEDMMAADTSLDHLYKVNQATENQKRINRGTYIYSVLAGLLLIVAGIFLDLGLNLLIRDGGGSGIALFTIVGYIGYLLYTFILVIKRLHDLNHSAWWFLTLFVPILGAVIGLECLFMRGTAGGNKFGSAPKKRYVLYWRGLFLPSDRTN